MVGASGIKRVVIEYEEGLTITHEGASAEKWAITYVEAIGALAALRAIQAKAESEAQAQQPASSSTEQPQNNIRFLRDVIDKNE